VNRVDSFLRLVTQLQADRLTLAVGRKATLVTGSALRPLTPDPLTHQQVLDLIEGIVRGEEVRQIEPGESRAFTYNSPFGAFGVTVSAKPDGGLQADLAPASAGASTVAAPAAAMGQAPGKAPAGPAAATPPPRPPAAGGDMDVLLRRLVSDGCSDLHMTTGCPPMFRKDGSIVTPGDAAPIPGDRMRELLGSIAPAPMMQQFEQTHDVDFAYEIPSVARFRCNLFLDRRGMGGVFRVIPAKTPTVEQLGLPRAILELCEHKKGLVLVTGPTGSGKSTTLAALIDHINRTRNAHIITIEDPIEFVHENRSCLVRQREVGRHTAGFKAALRAALREDPDIVLVGEMRDLETVAIAIETAETGHLVFGTLHTNTAASTVDRIVDQFPTDRHEQVRVMLSESLRGVVTQTLCRRKGGGRVAAFEILLVNPAVSNLIREGKTFQITSVMQTGKSQGMTCLNDSLLDLVKKGLVEPAEASHHAVAKTEFRAMLEKAGVKAEAATA
jgi:twitching motility protein PilT